MTDHWHYPRPALAAEYLRFFSTGITNSLVLFAHRRAGKTEMLQQDLAPAAEKAGYRVVYASILGSTLSPLATLLYALEKSLETRPFPERLRQFLTSPVSKLKLSGELPGAKGAAEIDLGELHGKAPADLLLYLGDLIARLAKSRKKLLLLIDEVQELATATINRPLVAALRTALDVNREHVMVVFTGSSREGLTRMFSDRDAPFFHFATQIDLPSLDIKFVSHVLAEFKKAAKREIDLKEAMHVFESLKHNPYYFRKVVENMLKTPGESLSQTLRYIREQIPVWEGYPATWIALRPLDREILLMLAQGESSMFTRASRAHLSKRLGVKQMSAAKVVVSVRRLLHRRLILRDAGKQRYMIEDWEFAVWITKNMG